MRYLALACDYDGTLAHDGKVAGETLNRLERLLATGRKLIMVTGRELDDLRQIFAEIKLFHRVVAENGAILSDPATGEVKSLAAAVPEALVRVLRARGVAKLSVGRVIVSAQRSQDGIIAAAIRELGLELQLIFNRGRVMILPPGVDKATGLMAALDSLHVSPRAVIGVGDAENDQAFLSACGFSVAVANALPDLKGHVNWTTRGEDGAGVGELIEELIDNDLESRETNIKT